MSIEYRVIGGVDMSTILTEDAEFRYRLLSRMKSDCNYYLGYGGRHAGHCLWAHNEEAQIEIMKELWNSFPAAGKPEWLTYEQILAYEKEMVREKAPLSEQIQTAAEKCDGQHSNRDAHTKEAERE